MRDKHGKLNIKSWKPQVSEESGVSVSEPHVVGDYRLRHSSKGSSKSESLKVFKPVNNGFKAALDHNTYRLVERSALHDV